MKSNFYIILIIPLILSACGTQSLSAPLVPSEDEVQPTATNPPVLAITQAPTEVLLASPTENLLPIATVTAEILPTRTPYVAVLFGAVKIEDAKTGSLLEPIAAKIFEMELQKLVDAGQIVDFQVEGLFVSVKGDHALYTEIMYRVKAGEDFWPEDGGTPAENGWVTGKCARFDFDSTPEEFQLTDKRLCN